MARCLVVGGAGFIGSHIVEALVERGDTVRVLDDLSSGHRQNLAGVEEQIEFMPGSIMDEATVRRAAAGIDLIFHLAAMVSVPQSMEQPVKAEQINALGTLNVLLAARDSGARRVVFSSTSAVYGDEPTLPKLESMPPAPKSPYAISKLAAEQYCRLFTEAFGLETVVLRYFNVFGPRQDPSSAYSGVISIFADRMARGESVLIYGDGEQTRDFVFVTDVARANLLAAAQPQAAGQTFNIGAGRAVSINHLFRTMADIYRLEVSPRYQPSRSGDIRHSYCDPSPAQAGLGWAGQVDFETGLRRLTESLG
jgi:nucleoside-diphosphate-sugar epimerase